MIYTDNQRSKCIMENDETKLKYVEVRYNFSREYIKKKRILLKYIDPKNILANKLTKDSNST